MLVPVVLSGGAGTRLWPVSREAHPKPFMRLPDGQSLLQKAFLRAVTQAGVVEVVTVTNRELYFKTKDDYRVVRDGCSARASYILEPFGRNTAAAVAAAALFARARHGDSAVLLVLPADHLIADDQAFRSAVDTAVKAASEGSLVTFGIRPDSPETGFGYIEAGDEMLPTGVRRVVRFVEKPSLQKAVEYLESGRYLWNSGMFCFAVGTVLAEFERHAPEVLEAVEACIGASSSTAGSDGDTLELDPALLDAVPDISIDYALMERSSRVAVVGCEMGWSDIGSWNALSALCQADEIGNRIDGEALLYDVRDCYIQSPHRIVGAVGVKDLVIVDTPDAVLIADRSRVQDVKQIVAQLKLAGHEAYKLHRTVHRPWGTYTVLEEGRRFKIKRIEVKPGASLSLQMHYHRSEHWIVVAGMARVVNGEREMLVSTNESTFIPAGHAHRLENPGKLDLVMIEVQSGEYLGEDDIVRFDDRYGRV